MKYIYFLQYFFLKIKPQNQLKKIKHMDLNIEKKNPMINLRQFAVEQNNFTPLSAFLSLCGLIVPFSQAPDTLVPFLLVLSPIYINKKSKVLCFILIMIAIFWPLNTRKSSNSWLIGIDDNDIIMRILLLIDCIYMLISFKKAGKYKMTPSQVENNQFPIVI